jgi:hypothetical protein
MPQKMSDQSQTTHLTGQIGGTDLIVCSKCGWTHMRLMDCSAPAPQPPTPRSHRVKTLMRVVECAHRLHETKHLSDAGLADILEAVDGE